MTTGKIGLAMSFHRPDQVQDFVPAPFDIATCMYYTGLARGLCDRKL